MSLTYTTTQTETKEREVRVSDHWGMFSGRGNKRIQSIFEEAVKRIEALCEIQEYGSPSKQEVHDELTRCLKKYVRLWDTKTYPESSDTAVRNQVLGFAEKLAAASGAFSRYGSRDAVDEAYTRAQREVF